MAPRLLSVPRVQFILSERLCQDPLKSFFSKQRAAGGCCDKPTVRQFCHNTVSLHLQGSAALEVIVGKDLPATTLMLQSFQNLYKRY